MKNHDLTLLHIHYSLGLIYKLNQSIIMIQSVKSGQSFLRETFQNSQSHFSHLECSHCGTVHDKNRLQTWCQSPGCVEPLIAVYDIPQNLSKEILKGRPTNMWRYREMLPVESNEHIISLGEGMTPLLHAESLGAQFDLSQLLIKDESGNPTNSFKARGLSMAVSKARELGAKSCVIPTAGNAGGALSAYCAKAGMKAYVYMPVNTPDAIKKECRYFGATVTEIDGNISDCARQIKLDTNGQGWFDVSTIKEPYRLEGKKTMGYEIAEQLNWEVPDVILYPTGGGTGLIGIWKAMNEMEEMGWIGSKRPRMVAVQTIGCYPIVRAFNQGLSKASFFENASTMANGLRVPAAFGDRMILNTLKESNGTAIAVSDKEILQAVSEIAQKEGIFVAPEGAATWAALKQLVIEGWVENHEQVLLLNTGSGYKYMENFPGLS